MKYMNKEEMEIFGNKYFKGFENDICKVSYFKFNNETEYLINDHYLLVV